MRLLFAREHSFWLMEPLELMSTNDAISIARERGTASKFKENNTGGKTDHMAVRKH